MKTIKELESSKLDMYDTGYYGALKDILELIDEVDFGVSVLMINRKGQGNTWVNVKELKARIEGGEEC